MAVVNFNNLTSANVRVSVKSKTPQSTITILDHNENPTLGGTLASVGCCLSERTSCKGGEIANFNAQLQHPNYYNSDGNLALVNNGTTTIVYVKMNNKVYQITHNRPANDDNIVTLANLINGREIGALSYTVNWNNDNSVRISNRDWDNKLYVKIYDSHGNVFFEDVICEYEPA